MKWSTVQLGTVADVVSGFGFPRHYQGDKSASIPFFKVGDMNLPGNSREMTEWTNTISASALKELKAKAFSAGTVIFPKIGAAIATGKKRLLICDATFDNNIMGLVPTKLVEPLFLYYWTLTFDFTSISNIGPVPSMRKSTVESLDFPLPPLSEQRRIVELLDQADTLRQKRAEADTKVERILPALFIKTFGNPVEWTSTANTMPLGKLIEIQSGGSPSKQNAEYWNGDIPWVSPKDMKQDMLWDSSDHISRSAIEGTNLKYVTPGTVLIVVRGMILARAIPIAIAGVQLAINQDLKALCPKSHIIDSTYLYSALKVSEHMLLSQVRTAAHGTRKLDTDELLQIPILIPSRQALSSFQQAFTTLRETLFRIRKTREIFEGLSENLLHRAFSGNLTAKWRETHIKELLTEMREQAKALKPQDIDDSERQLSFYP